MTDPSPGVAAAVEGELRLLDPVVRASADLLSQVLHPDYREIDSSGRVWDRDTMIASLTAADAPRAGQMTASRMSGIQLADDLVHLTYDTETKGHLAHRSSVWRLTESGWELYYHQATPFGSATDAGPDNGQDAGPDTGTSG
ncbi:MULTISPECIES: nuclear transport factor 2 family protein [Streptomyces]|uniref:nuclear transport factor 2 family protein n=1 Tax=Streptomyces TaxID=1883 RepID=UPI0022555CD4|nr:MULTISPECIES: nuclear transport factor 2 family protein [unclassified Streptomyces]WTB57555.1 nuclear transport factor 2 family protein [Streptomyces sp. NBC_00826]WTH89563.1 nuclear transport factor 2 family protein [Streptomyces sp. NBC_00825]WTH98290.1 nuclear transport factor 2 family protein [Streptomyces sp. NBC_00822]MCX4863648.1 nuclear transport factor 2 family protein [Streptomyces sp. NBC_00906]MCX4894886.1 nuclear transport factor 2 family protein [Streptomyces sp. NBC_00892]